MEAYYIRNYGAPNQTTYKAGGDFTTLKTQGYLPSWLTGVSYVNNFYTNGFRYRNRLGVWVTDKGLNGLLNFLVWHNANFTAANLKGLLHLKLPLCHLIAKIVARRLYAATRSGLDRQARSFERR